MHLYVPVATLVQSIQLTGHRLCRRPLFQNFAHGSRQEHFLEFLALTFYDPLKSIANRCEKLPFSKFDNFWIILAFNFDHLGALDPSDIHLGHTDALHRHVFGASHSR